MLARGILFRINRRMSGGKFLCVARGVCVNKRKDVKIYLGYKVKLYHDVAFYLDAPNATISIGEGTYVNRRTEIKCQSNITIGKRCAISWDVVIMDTDYHSK